MQIIQITFHPIRLRLRWWRRYIHRLNLLILIQISQHRALLRRRHISLRLASTKVRARGMIRERMHSTHIAHAAHRHLMRHCRHIIKRVGRLVRHCTHRILRVDLFRSIRTIVLREYIVTAHLLQMRLPLLSMSAHHIGWIRLVIHVVVQRCSRLAMLMPSAIKLVDAEFKRCVHVLFLDRRHFDILTERICVLLAKLADLLRRDESVGVLLSETQIAFQCAQYEDGIVRCQLLELWQPAARDTVQCLYVANVEAD
mmetsp:Transcript_42856/g.68769  ORF Transcript_42856/g.68769 Transcript_42856/m.68769 type:complete len:256 (-) Transcript_42856:324-1091(-)